eukprot:TRINITY_DN3249_c0_g1_i1.p1 TRINITY_DN3249_c0_g1~~TRINITY_DN3249_c0_g1_i1.p1  ORF type:complete len:611 (-),score=124.66 TRINITY_DN3249_c0_g1_i1:443-2275(-)
MRQIGKRLRLDLKKDIEGVMRDFGSLHASPRSDGPGHRSQVRDLSGGFQEIHIPPRCVTAPPGIGRRPASMDDLYQCGDDFAQTNSRQARIKPEPLPAKRGAPLDKPKELPGQFPIDTDLQEDCLPGLSDERGNKPDNTISSWVAEAWQADFSDAKPLGQGTTWASHHKQVGFSDGATKAAGANGEGDAMAQSDGWDRDQECPKTSKESEASRFSCIFGVELLLRLSVFRAEFFYIEGWAWNIFDTICVSFSVLDAITDYLLAGTGVKQALDNLSILRVLRLFRILRLVRMVRFIPALKSMVYLIAASLQSFFWTLVLIVGVMYIYAVYLTEIATELKHDGKSTDVIQEYWGDLFTSISTLFQAITGGDDWHNFISGFKAVEGDKYTQNLIFFILYIAFASLVLMNLVTGVFVEGAQRIAAEEKRQDLQKQVRKVVQVSKNDINASIDWDEFNEQLSKKEMECYLKAFQMDQSQAKDIFYILDDMRTGTITMKDFFSACMQLHGAVRLSDTEILRHRLMHSISDINERMDSIEDLLLRARTQSHRESPAAKDFPGGNIVEPFSPVSDVPGTAPGVLQQRAQSPIPFPLPPNISGYLLKTGNNKHMVRWIY